MIRKLALYAALVLIFTIPWETAITISSLGTLTRLVGFAAAGIWVASVLIEGKFRKFSAYHYAVLSFMLINVASLFWTVSYDLTVERIKTYLQLAILTWILWDLFATPETFHMALQAFIFGGYITIVSQLFNFVAGQTISNYNAGRFTGAGQNAGEFALILSLTLPLAWHLATTQKPGSHSLILKVINFAYIPLALLATVLTASRTSLVTNLPGLLYIAVTFQKIKPFYRALIFIVVVSAIIAVTPLIPQATLERLSTFGSSIAGNDLGGRTALWAQSFEIFKNHPFLGIGSNALSAPGQLGAYAHNTFLSIMAELGLVGLIQFLLIVAIVVYKAVKQPSSYAILWMTVFIIWLIGVCTLTWEYTKATWFFLSLIIISAGIYKSPENIAETPPIPDVPFVHQNTPAA